MGRGSPRFHGALSESRKHLLRGAPETGNPGASRASLRPAVIDAAGHRWETDMGTRRTVAATTAALLIAAGTVGAGATLAQARESHPPRHGIGVGHGAPGMNGPLKDRWLESQVDRQVSAEARLALREALSSARDTYRLALESAGSDAALRETARRAYLTAVGEAVAAFDAATLPADVAAAVTAYRSAVRAAAEAVRTAIQESRGVLRVALDDARARLATALVSATTPDEEEAARSAFRTAVNAARTAHVASLHAAQENVKAAIEKARTDLLTALPA